MWGSPHPGKETLAALRKLIGHAARQGQAAKQGMAHLWFTEWSDLVQDVGSSFARLTNQNEQWVLYLDALSDQELLNSFECRHANGQPFSPPPVRSDVLFHVFNHGTHHR
jgi:hypothetical protein